MKRARRRFLKVVAAGTAALVMPASVLAQAAPRRKPARPVAKPAPKPAAPGVSAAAIAQQKAAVAQTLKALREVPLANGVEPAFAFRAIRRARGGR